MPKGNFVTIYNLEHIYETYLLTCLKNSLVPAVENCSVLCNKAQLFDVLLLMYWFDISSVQLLTHVWLFATPWTAKCQASLSITNSWSLLKLMSVESVMLSNHLILCRPLLLPSIFPSIRVFSNESALCIRWPKYWSFSSASVLPVNIQG